MYILGLNIFHGDSSACLFKDNNLIGAAEEERFRRIKHWAGFPSESIKWCLLEAGINLEDSEGMNALEFAESMNALKELLNRTKDPDNQDEDGIDE